MAEIARVGALHQLMENVGPVFDAGYFTPAAAKHMSTAMEEVCHRLRPQLIPLTETKAQLDIVVPSVIGNSYGDIYELNLKVAKDSSLNHLDKDGVPPQWEEYIKPFLHDEPEVKHYPMPTHITKSLQDYEKMYADAKIAKAKL